MVRLSSRHNEIEDENDDSCTPSCGPLDCFPTAGMVAAHESSRSAETGEVLSPLRRGPGQRTFIAKKKQLDRIWTMHAFIAEAMCLVGNVSALGLGGLQREASIWGLTALLPCAPYPAITPPLYCSTTGVTGILALVKPETFEVFMNLDEQHPKCQKMLDQANTIIRLYGALILSQGWLVWQTRHVPNPYVRKTFVESYLVCFSLSTLALGYRQITSSDWKGVNWAMTSLFAVMAAVYGCFYLTKPLPEFEHAATAAV